MHNTCATRSAICAYENDKQGLKMAGTVADLPKDRFSELAGYLRGYSPDHPDSEEGSLLYWEMIAERLRYDLPSKFSDYTEIVSSP